MWHNSLLPQYIKERKGACIIISPRTFIPFHFLITLYHLGWTKFIFLHIQWRERKKIRHLIYELRQIITERQNDSARLAQHPSYFFSSLTRQNSVVFDQNDRVLFMIHFHRQYINLQNSDFCWIRSSQLLFYLRMISTIDLVVYFDQHLSSI